MTHSRKIRGVFAALTAATTAFALASCTSSDPLEGEASGGSDETITIGTANFPESEIIGQVWAEELRAAGFDVEVTSGIGSREVYLSALENGEIDIVPEYTGNLAEFYDGDIEQGAAPEEVFEEVKAVLPEGLAAGEFAPGESKDSFVVTPETAEENDLETLSDLANMDSIVLAGNPELAERPYGPRGLTEIYDVPADSISMNAISDGGGPLTVAALLNGEADVADIYSTSPHLDSEGNEVELVTLKDPENMVLSQNVLPIYRADAVPTEAIDALNSVNAELTTEDLEAMNLRNVGEEKAEPATIAKDYVSQ